MNNQNTSPEIVILPHSELMPIDEAQKKARALAEMQEQLLTMSRQLPDKLQVNKYLPGNPRLRDLDAGSFFFSRNKDLIYFHLVFVPLFSQKIDSVSLGYNTDHKSSYEDSFRGGWALSFNMFSDGPLRTAYAQFVKQQPDKASYPKTIYLFNEAGNFAKVIRVHKDFPVERQVMLDLKIAMDYFSDMTRMDFAYAEQALLIMHDWIEDYRQLN